MTRRGEMGIGSSGQIQWATMLKRDYVFMGTHFCRAHHIRYIFHPACFLKEKPSTAPDRPEHIGFLDIETTNLAADFGYVICWVIQDETGKEWGGCLEPADVLGYTFDKRIMTEYCKVIREFDRLIVHYGKDRRHDIPFMRTRALRWHLDFPEYGEQFVTDTFDIAKNKFKWSRNRLQNLAQACRVASKTHRMDPERWCRCMAGDAAAIRWAFVHCQEDVTSLRRVYKQIQRYARRSKVSI